MASKKDDEEDEYDEVDRYQASIDLPTAGYCALCRREELDLYDELVDDERHIFACKEAGCLHPAFYY